MYQHLRTKTYQTPSIKKEKSAEREKFVAVWLDHKQAIVLSLRDAALTAQTIQSNLPPKRRSTGGIRSKFRYADFFRSSEHNEHQWREELTNRYFELVTAALEGATRIVLLGPGPMKRTLFHRFQKNKSLATKLDNEPITVGRLTEAQLERLVREYFFPLEPEERADASHHRRKFRIG